MQININGDKKSAVINVKEVRALTEAGGVIQSLANNIEAVQGLTKEEANAAVNAINKILKNVPSTKSGKTKDIQGQKSLFNEEQLDGGETEHAAAGAGGAIQPIGKT